MEDSGGLYKMYENSVAVVWVIVFDGVYSFSYYFSTSLYSPPLLKVVVGVPHEWIILEWQYSNICLHKRGANESLRRQ